MEIGKLEAGRSVEHTEFCNLVIISEKGEERVKIHKDVGISWDRKIHRESISRVEGEELRDTVSLRCLRFTQESSLAESDTYSCEAWGKILGP